MLPRNVAALINSMGALGSFCGSWMVGYLNGATGSPSASYIFMGVALFASVWLTLIVKLLTISTFRQAHQHKGKPHEAVYHPVQSLTR
ncbi:MAG: transporter [Proteobacteria bacterium]|nr:transporter [Pseudomonadota bacterium]